MTTSTKQELQQARDIAQKLVDARLTTSQIRKFLAQVNKYRQKVTHMESEKWEPLFSQIQMLEPRFVYQIAKLDIQAFQVQAFKVEVCKRLQGIESPEDYLRFADFIEAVVAYHEAFAADRKAVGGRR
jgi:CRISPR type III-A-associated protein Csm2